MPKTVALGTKLYVESDTPGTFVAVGNLTSISVPGPDKPEIDVTDFDSLAAESLPGLLDNGSFDYTGFHNDEDPGQELMFNDANDPNAPLRTMHIEFTNQAQRFVLNGYVKSHRPNAPGPREAYTFAGSVRVSGAVTREDIS